MDRVFAWGPADAVADPARSILPDRFEPSSWATREIFTADECDAIVALRERRAAAAGTLVNGVATDGIRRSRLIWLEQDDPEVEWIAQRLTRAVADLNRDHFGFALSGFDEQIQLTEYTDANLGFYDWHSDVGGRGIPRTRKLTLTVQLSDSTDYQGGALELNFNGNPVEAPRDRGVGTAFPSYTLHRVCPVTSGVRHSLVVWTHGPRFT
ncbi:MAG: 2OG-Fe(II) oxygenase [Caenispirillum bisanense]|nr:2OG-Fe(II) oxygenase [Caenispirillum bisanense]MCA1972921.1 2OG-Fe(II) oxygenase [Caenispirillum sp.]